MILRIFKHTFSNEKATINYTDIECLSFEVLNNLLVLHKQDKVHYMPLVHIVEFVTLQESESENS